ncbi:MAG TPA: PLP-dependent aspartate aminotransferase family protein [Actinomycetota bacterium]
MDDLGFTTRAVRHPERDLGGARPSSVPIYQSSTYTFDDPEVLAEWIRKGKDAGFVYTRWHNPTRAALEEVIANLEGAERAVSFGSGMAAISTTVLSQVKAGDHVVASPHLYGGAFSVMSRMLPRYGVDVTIAASHRAEDMLAAIHEGTVFCYTETIGNPRCSVPDLAALAAGTRERGTCLIVDNTFASPYLCNPLALGVDIVVHSSTKYLGGHHDLIGGIAAGSHDRLHDVRELSAELGGVPGPFDAWLVLRGVQTLALRMDRQCGSAQAIAELLESHDKVANVWYPGLPSHPDHEVAARQLRGFSGMLSFELAGGFEAGERFQSSLEVALVGASLGGVGTLVTHPPSVTHTQLSREDRERAGIPDGMVRVSVGIEDTEDLLEDFSRALEKA